MMLRRWSLQFLGTALLFTTGVLPLPAQSRGHFPDRLQQLDQIGQSTQMLDKGLPTQAMSTYTNTESDYLDPAFWDAPPFDDSSVSFTWPKSWKTEDRQGDSRLKCNRLLVKQNPQHDGTGTDHFYLRFDLKRVVTSASEFTSQGHLGDALCAEMTGVGLLSAKAKIQIMMSLAFAKPDYMAGLVPVHLHSHTYDVVIVDINGTPLNIVVPGLRYGGGVKPIDFTVPTSALRFPVKGDPEPTPAWNIVHFKVIPPKVRSPIMYSAGYVEVPASFIQCSFTMDAELTFGAVAPIMLVHGTNGDPSTWNVPDKPAGRANFNQFFGSHYFPYFSDIALTPNGGIDSNGQELGSALLKRLQSIGAKACHIIAHSKGGLDSRSFINHHYWDKLNTDLYLRNHFEVLSLYTLDTPHRGTVLSDIVWNSRYNAGLGAITMWPDIQNVMDWDLGLVHLNYPNPWNRDNPAKAPTGSALLAQTTINMRSWNEKNLFDMAHANTGGRQIKFYNTAGDADWHVRDRNIDDIEREFSGYPGNAFAFVATSAYRMLYWAKEVRVKTTQRLDGFNQPYNVTVLFVAPDQVGAEWNDIVVSASSAVYDGGTLFHGDPASINGITLSNHSAIKTYDMADAIMRQILSDWPLSTP